jgi:hypothetical protein
MNERIKELELEAAYDIIDPNGPFTADEFNQFTKKFAELIIRECANITLDYKNHDHYYGWMDHGEEIIRHFGIER